ncbi:hypothetical protein Kpho01_18420 [Kitasatospora phosalacinea]|uniref:Uncharacterized protein n=1 Tax=Kitasatospora phosalacinea TaxID=2065 RepID=A0A9W6UKX0_9ACTN|nr:hypothetical protein Kpho01_18420 [Kitasatospora phosalacinea]
MRSDGSLCPLRAWLTVVRPNPERTASASTPSIRRSAINCRNREASSSPAARPSGSSGPSAPATATATAPAREPDPFSFVRPNAGERGIGQIRLRPSTTAPVPGGDPA